MHSYLVFPGIAALVALTPGPDVVLTLRSTVRGGRRAGWWTVTGILVAASLQGVLAAIGLGALIVAAGPLFTAIRWAGVAAMRSP